MSLLWFYDLVKCRWFGSTYAVLFNVLALVYICSLVKCHCFGSTYEILLNVMILFCQAIYVTVIALVLHMQFCLMSLFSFYKWNFVKWLCFRSTHAILLNGFCLVLHNAIWLNVIFLVLHTQFCWMALLWFYIISIF